MNKIFIDANVYLLFYKSNNSAFKNLLPALQEIKDYIFIPQQIIYEIERNKLKLFHTSFDGYIKNLQLGTVTLPSHIEGKGDSKISEWNKEAKVVRGKLEKLQKDLLEIKKQKLSEINNSTDEISKVFNKIYEKAISVSSGVLYDKARLRKEIGNPPGKISDPLGDQICWELLLENINEVEHLWIVTQDGDYCLEEGGEVYLKPILNWELKQINKEIKIHIFNSLPEALKSFRKETKINIKSLPNKEELERIREEEIKISKNENEIYESLKKGWWDNLQKDIMENNFSRSKANNLEKIWHVNMKVCQNCGNSYTPEILQGEDGIFSYWPCPFCHH